MPERKNHVRDATRVLQERMILAGKGMCVAFLLGWVAWFAPFDDLLDQRGTPLGADYAMFYAAGCVVREGNAGRLYDQSEHQRRLQAILPGIKHDFCLPYRYPPFVALLMAPLAALPYVASYAVFASLSCAAWWATAVVLAAELCVLRGAWRKPTLWAMAGFPVAWETLIGGQAALFGVLILSLGVVLLRRERFWLAGCVLALAAYKPNLLAFVVLGCTLRHPRLLRGLVPTLGLLAILSLLPGGWSVFSEYVSLGTRLTVQAWDVETPPWKVHSLACALALVPGLPARACCLGLGLMASVTIAAYWRRAAGNAAASLLAVGLLVSANALFNPYTPIYDLSLLGVAALLTVEGIAAQQPDVTGRGVVSQAVAPGSIRLVQLLLAVIFLGPHTSQLIAQLTGVQPFPFVLAAVGVWQAAHFARAVARAERPAIIRQPWQSAGL